MRKLLLLVVATLIVLCVSSRTYAVFVLDKNDTKTIEKRIVNEDGTVSIVKETVITAPFVFPEMEERIEEIKSKRPKVTHANRRRAVRGEYKPKEPEFTVVTRRPKDWPIPEHKGKARDVPTIATTTKKPGWKWIISLACMGVIGYAGIRLTLYIRASPDPNKA